VGIIRLFPFRNREKPFINEEAACTMLLLLLLLAGWRTPHGFSQ